MPEDNLVTLVKFERKDIVNPTEQFDLCTEHFRQEEDELKRKGYEAIKSPSSMPKSWCVRCSPPEEMYN